MVVVMHASKTIQETAMNHGTKTMAHPELTGNLPRNGGFEQ